MCYPRVLCISYNGTTLSHCRAANAMSTLRSLPTGLPLRPPMHFIILLKNSHILKRWCITLRIRPPNMDLKHHPVIHVQIQKCAFGSRKTAKLKLKPSRSWMTHHCLTFFISMTTHSHCYHLHLSIWFRSASLSSHWIFLCFNWIEYTLPKYSHAGRETVLLTIPDNTEIFQAFHFKALLK